MSNHNFQKAALALLVRAPSTLNRLWASGEQEEVREELVRLGLSDAFIPTAMTSLANMRQEKAGFTTVADQMDAHIWGRGEPHPPDDEARRIATALRMMDGD
jgi:hypothetical protein